MSTDIEALQQDETEFAKVMTVGREYAKGYSNNEIAQRLEMNRRDVSKYIKQYKDMVQWSARNNMTISDKIAVVLEEVDDHYRMIIRDAWENKAEADLQGQLSTVNQALSLIAKVQQQRAKMFQEFSSEQDAELIAQMEEQQQQHDQIIKILRGLNDRYPQAAAWVRDQLAKVNDEVESIEVIDD